MSDSMIRRNGGMTTVVVGVLVFFGCVYMVYLYNDVSGQLKNTERTAERYRREQESLSAQLQDLKSTDEEKLRRCESDKEQMNTRFTTLNQQYKMLKSQHEDMETEYGRIQSEKQRELDEHRKLDEERTLEYNQFKQEKLLEISSLKDTIANSEREKEQMNEEINQLKSQLQNSLDSVQQQQQQILQLQHQQQLNQQQQNQQQQQNFQGQQGGMLFQGNNQGPMGAVGVQEGLQQAQNVQVGNQAGGFNPGLQQLAGQQGLEALQQGMGQAVQQGIFNQQQQQHQGIEGQNFQPINAEGMNMAADVLKSLQDKHKPVDAAAIEEQQKQHQILPPGESKNADNYGNEGEKKDLGNEKHAQNMFQQNGQDVGMKQILKPNLNPDEAQLGIHNNDNGEGGGDGNHGDQDNQHDNRIENQGPVNLQVQEPNMKAEGQDNLQFKPALPADPVDNQMQPQHPVDDSQRQEQMEIPAQPLHPQGMDQIEEKLAPLKDDNDDYDDEYDNDNEKQKNIEGKDEDDY